MGRPLPDLVEDQITYPIFTHSSPPQIETVRGESFLGNSFVYIIFEDGTDIYWARCRVIEYLNSSRANCPRGVIRVWVPMRPVWDGFTICPS